MGSKADSMWRRNNLDLISGQHQGRKSHLLSPFLSDWSLKVPLKCWLTKNLEHLIPFFPKLSARRSITYLAWIYRYSADEGSLKKWLQLCAMFDMSQFHISEIFSSEAFWQWLRRYFCTSSSQCLTFPCCVFLLSTQTATELPYLQLEGSDRKHWGQAAPRLCPSIQDHLDDHIIGLLYWQCTNNLF